MQQFSQNTQNANGNEESNNKLNNDAKEQVESTPGEVVKGSSKKEQEEKPNAIDDLDKLKK